MKHLIIALFLAAFSFAASAQPVSEIDLLSGQTISYTAAGTHLEGFNVQEGGEFVEVSLNGALLTIKGLKPGDAKLLLSLRGGNQSPLLVHVLRSSFIRPASKPEQPEDKPKWDGGYELRLPETNYSIIYHSFREDGSEWMRETYSCIGEVFVRSESFLSEDGYNGMEDIISVFDFENGLGYSGGLMPNGRYKLYYADGDEILDENKESSRQWFSSHAPKSLAQALYGTSPAAFGRDNNGDDKLESGTIMQRIRMSGGDQSKLKSFYKGEETICGRKCWVFDFRGRNFYGFGGFCVWVDQETGLTLRQEGEEGGGFIVTRFDLDYHDWDIQIRPDLFEKK